MLLGDEANGCALQLRLIVRYQAEVSGGQGAGMAQLTVTIVCEDCQELYDVVTSELTTGKRNSDPLSRICLPLCPSLGESRLLPKNWRAPQA